MKDKNLSNELQPVDRTRLQDAFLRLRYNSLMMSRIERPSISGDSYLRIMHFDFSNFLSAMYNMSEVAKALVGKGTPFWSQTRSYVKNDELLNYFEVCRHLEEHSRNGSAIRKFDKMLNDPSLPRSAFIRLPWGFRELRYRSRNISIPSKHRGEPIDSINPTLGAIYVTLWWSEYCQQFSTGRFKLPTNGIPQLPDFPKGFTADENLLHQEMMRVTPTSGCGAKIKIF